MKTDDPILEKLCSLLDTAHALLRANPVKPDQSERELAQAVATAHFCAHRLAAERTSPKRKPARKL